MTKAAIITVMIMIFSVAVYGQGNKISGFVEFQTNTNASGTTPQINLSVERPVTKKVKLWGYATSTVASKGRYSEAYGGLAYSPKPWIELAAGVGAENPRNLRLGGYVWTGKGRVSNLLILEGKGSGFWYKDIANYSVGKGVKVGIKAQRFKGAGPDVEYEIPHTPLRAWGAVLFSGDHGPVAQFGLRYSFKF